MINHFLKELDAFICASDAISDIEIIRRDIRDTGLEKTLIYRYRLKLKDESLVELTERLIEEKGNLRTTKYRYHWQTQSGEIIRRWDNAPHHPEIVTFPDHLHEGSEDNVVSFKKVSVLAILSDIMGSVNNP
jgi:hypothetical protein